MRGGKSRITCQIMRDPKKKRVEMPTAISVSGTGCTFKPLFPNIRGEMEDRRIRGWVGNEQTGVRKRNVEVITLVNPRGQDTVKRGGRLVKVVCKVRVLGLLYSINKDRPMLCSSMWSGLDEDIAGQELIERR
jgi:hypothetical protein